MRGGGESEPGVLTMANSPSPILVGLLLRWAERAFENDLRARAGARPRSQLRDELRALLYERHAVSRCPQCALDARATIEPGGADASRTAPPYHPKRCPYLWALMTEMADWLSRDPARLAEWHRRAVERYAK